MKTLSLGKSDLQVTPICLGTMTFGEQVNEADAHAIMDRALERGVNFWDTAEIYAVPTKAETYGATETIIGHWLAKNPANRQKIVLASKVAGPSRGMPWVRSGQGMTSADIVASCEASLKRLKTDVIDLYQIHGFDPLTPFEESLSALNDLVRAGKIRTLGLCNLAAWQIMKALSISRHNHWAEFASVQAYYSIAGRDLEREVMPLVEDQKLGLMIWSPLAGGYLSGKFRRNSLTPDESRRSTFDFPPLDKEKAFACIDAMEPIAKNHGVSIAQVALAWILSKQSVSTIIIGARKLEQLKDNIASTKLTLNEDELQSLDAVSALAPEYPGWMLAFQGQYRAKAPFKD
jgi:aryl-alcohol dehydrogenase-like predicted oxidoreductase